MGTPLANAMIAKWAELPFEMKSKIINVNAFAPLQVHLMSDGDNAGPEHDHFIFAVEPKKWQAVLSNLHISSETRKAAILALRKHSSLEHVLVDENDVINPSGRKLRYQLPDDVVGHFKTLFLVTPYNSLYRGPAAADPDFTTAMVEIHIQVPVRRQDITLTAINITADKPLPEWSDSALELVVRRWLIDGGTTVAWELHRPHWLATLIEEFLNGQSSVPPASTPLLAAGRVADLRQIVKRV